MSKRVLLIDDESDIREVATVSLESVADWKILEASSGEEGLATAAAAVPDAILLDVMMPGMDGPQTYERLQADARTRNIPVILLTAKVQAADQRRFAALGVQGLIAKPFDPLQLPWQVEEMLGWAVAAGDSFPP